MEVAKMISKAKNVLVLTGAGCSKESGTPVPFLTHPEKGIPTYRDSDDAFAMKEYKEKVEKLDTDEALWSKYDPKSNPVSGVTASVYSSIEGFKMYPEKCWELTREFVGVINKCQPNDAHKAIAEMYNNKLVSAVITQNVDSLHQVSLRLGDS